MSAAAPVADASVDGWVPTKAAKEDPIPVSLWPDLKGVLEAKTRMVDSTLAAWRKFWKDAAKHEMVSVDTETNGLRPFHGNRIVGVSAAYYDGKEVVSGYWNFRHTGHPAHPWCRAHWVDEDHADPEVDYKVTKKVDGVQWSCTTSPKDKKKCEVCAKGWCEGYEEEAPVIPTEELAAMEPALRDRIIAGQNFKFDMKMFSRDGVRPPRRVIDTMLVAHLWDENSKKYSLEVLGKEIGEKKLGDSVKEYMEAHGLTAEGHGHEQVPHELERPYAVADTVIVLKRLQWERDRWLAEGDPRLMEVFQVENASSTVFAKMEIAGMRLDTEFIAAGIKRLETELRDIETEIFEISKKQVKELRKNPKWTDHPTDFNIGSIDQLAAVLQLRGVPLTKLTDKGKTSLTEFDLGQITDPLAALVKEWRSRVKMHGTYFKPFLETHCDPSKFLHCDFFIHGTVSGRASCREPNLQNITRFERFGSRGHSGSMAQAIRQKEWGAVEGASEDLQVRRCFIPRTKDHSIFFFDYAQMELRIFAEYAEEEFMIDAIEHGKDVHAETAKKVFPNFPDKDKDPKLYSYFRQLAKQISFGLLYGMGVNKLATTLDVPVDHCVRALQMVRAAAAEGFEIRKATTLSLEEVESHLEDHRIMTASRQWSGLRELGKEVARKVDVDQLAEFLFGTKEMKEKHQRLEFPARQFLDDYHGQFPKIKKFMKGIDEAVRSRGYLFNKYGRRYHLRPEESYIGVNRLVQGTSAEMVKIAQVRVQEMLEREKAKSVFMNQVHDELQVDIHHDELHLVPRIKAALEYFPNLRVKMVVDVEYGHESWAKKTKWEGPEAFAKTLAEYRESTKKEKRG